MKGIFSKIILFAFGTGSAQILNFFFSTILVRFLTPLEYAVWKQGNLLVVLLGAFFTVISPISLGYFLAKTKEKEEKKAYVIQIIVINSSIAIIGGLIIFLSKEKIINMYSNELLREYLIYFILIIFMEVSMSYYTYFTIAENLSKKMIKVTIIFSLVRLMSLIVCINFNINNKFRMFMILYLLTLVVKYIYVLYDTLKYFSKFKMKISKVTLKNQSVFSIPLFFTGFLSIINVNMDKNFVSLLYSPELYAVYVNGAFEIPFVSIISTSIITVMLPEISKKYNSNNESLLKDIAEEFKKVIEISSILMIPIIISILVFSEGVVKVLFSEKYISALPLFRFYLFMLIPKIINIGVLITSANKQKILIRNSIIMMSLNLILLIVINKSLGFYFLTIAPVISVLIFTFKNIKDVVKLYNLKYITEIIPIKFIIQVIGISSGIGIGFLILNYFSGMNIILKTMIFGPIAYILMILVSIYFLKRDMLKYLTKEKSYER